MAQGTRSSRSSTLRCRRLATRRGAAWRRRAASSTRRASDARALLRAHQSTLAPRSRGARKRKCRHPSRILRPPQAWLVRALAESATRAAGHALPIVADVAAGLQSGRPSRGSTPRPPPFAEAARGAAPRAGEQHAAEGGSERPTAAAPRRASPGARGERLACMARWLIANGNLSTTGGQLRSAPLDHAGGLACAAPWPRPKRQPEARVRPHGVWALDRKRGRRAVESGARQSPRAAKNWGRSARASAASAVTLPLPLHRPPPLLPPPSRAQAAFPP